MTIFKTANSFAKNDYVALNETLGFSIHFSSVRQSVYSSPILFFDVLRQRFCIWDPTKKSTDPVKKLSCDFEFEDPTKKSPDPVKKLSCDSEFEDLTKNLLDPVIWFYVVLFLVDLLNN